MAPTQAQPFVLPNPVFEGSEKRIEVDFKLSASSPANGLRALTREQLDELMTLAACTIVSNRKNEDLDAYVLSESSLFVYPTKYILKTCGTTKLLHSIPRLLEFAAALGMEPRRCKFSRASFLFPEQQHFPHTSFDDETAFLRQYFGHLGTGGSAYTLGDKFHGLQWHVYVADAEGTQYTAPGRRPTFNLEVIMTELDPAAAQQFFRTDKFVSAARTTLDSGIAGLVPGAVVDDYVFDPCGYSMNGIDGAGLITVHITPEAGFSYASVELSGFEEGAFCANDMVARIAAIFLPGRMCVSMSTDHASKTGYTWGSLAAAPGSFGCHGATCQELSCGGRVSYYSMVADAPKRLAAGAARSASPVSVLRHMPSFCSAGSALSDSDLYMRSDSDMYTSEEESDAGLVRTEAGALAQRCAA